MLLKMLVVPSKLLLITVFLQSLLTISTMMIEFSRIIVTMAAGIWRRRRQFKPLIFIFYIFFTKKPLILILL